MSARSTGARAARVRRQLYPICRSITGEGVRADAAPDRRAHSARDPRGAERHARLRLGGAARMEHRGRGVCRSRRRPRRRLPARTICTSSATRSRVAQTLSLERAASRTCTRCPSTRTGSRTARATTGATGDSACATASASSCAPATTGSRSKLAGARLADLRRVRDSRPQSREEVLFFTHVCHPSLANDNTSGMAIADGAGAMARERAAPLQLSLRVRARHDRLAVLAEAERAAARPRAPRPGARPARRLRPAHLQDESRRERRDRRRRRATCCRGIDPQARVIRFSPTATTSGSCARRASTCRSAG